MVTDGPFAETREQLGGYFLIDATDLEPIQLHEGLECVAVRATQPEHFHDLNFSRRDTRGLRGDDRVIVDAWLPLAAGQLRI